jgi:Pretoxin HINT domain
MKKVMRTRAYSLSAPRVRLLLLAIISATTILLLAGQALAASTQITPTTAERLVEQADRAAVDGDMARRFALLREAVRLDPEYQLARWQLGQVQVGGEWLAVEEAQRRAAANPREADYRRRRSEYGDDAAGQLALARWCRKNDLDDEARFHWASVLSNQPRHREALRGLGVRWTDGQLMTGSQLDAAKEQRFEARRASREWQSQVVKWQHSLARSKSGLREQVLDEIRAIDAPAAIATIESVTLAGDPRDNGGSAWRSDMSLAFVTALEAMTDHAATVSLARHAVLSPFDTVRQSAAERLRYRSLHDFVPGLLDALAMPVESSFRVVTGEDGSVRYLHTLYREGSHADWSGQRMRTALQRPVSRRILARLAGDMELPDPADEARLASRAAVSASRASTGYAREAAAVDAQVAAMNQATAALNERIVAVLANVSGKDYGSQPRDWWNWWSEYNEYDQSQERPVYESSESSYELVPPPQRHECFVKGTPVWTKTGQRPIESLELGDLVLAQNVDSGELAYKPVIAQTLRPPSAILKLSIGGEELRSTRGHPMWVAGVGWRMAKEIEDGAVLHGITCTPRISAVEPAGEAEAYNLVVAEFNTYFVGESGILVHDNTPRRPTRASVPGLMAK